MSKDIKYGYHWFLIEQKSYDINLNVDSDTLIVNNWRPFKIARFHFWNHQSISHVCIWNVLVSVISLGIVLHNYLNFQIFNNLSNMANHCVCSCMRLKFIGWLFLGVYPHPGLPKHRIQFFNTWIVLHSTKYELLWASLTKSALCASHIQYTGGKRH